MRVRSARPHDARALASLLDDVARETPATLLLAPGEATAKSRRRRIAAASLDYHSLFLVAIVGGNLVGNLSLERDAHPNSAHAACLGISVARGYRSLGIGALLLESASEWAASSGVTKLQLGVFPENTRATGFYERHGFVREGSRRAQYVRDGRYHDETLMARFITSNV